MLPSKNIKQHWIELSITLVCHLFSLLIKHHETMCHDSLRSCSALALWERCFCCMDACFSSLMCLRDVIDRPLRAAQSLAELLTISGATVLLKHEHDRLFRVVWQSACRSCAFCFKGQIDIEWNWYSLCINMSLCPCVLRLWGQYGIVANWLKWSRWSQECHREGAFIDFCGPHPVLDIVWSLSRLIKCVCSVCNSVSASSGLISFDSFQVWPCPPWFPSICLPTSG